MPSPDWRQRTDLAEDEDTERPPEGDALASENHLLPGRTVALVVAFALIMIAVVARVISWTVFPAVSNADTRAPVAPPSEALRGRILDRNGLLMSTDTFFGRVYAWPQKIRDDKQRGETAVMSTALALQRPVESIEAAVAITQSIASLETEATVGQCDAINQIYDGELVWCDFSRKRNYPQGPLAAHVLGFLNHDRVGLYGVEARYDNWLNPEQRWQGSVPAETIEMPNAWKMFLPSPVADDLVLNLDVPLQYMVERRLQDAVAKYQAESGTIIIMDPRSGAVLAMANSPTFDPNQFSSVNENTWVNSAISEIYEPGSVFKLVTISAGLDAGYITPDSVFLDQGSLAVGGRVVRNAERLAYGNVTVREALAKSLNVVSAQIALRMGAETFYKYVGLFGFGKLTEVDLQSEVRGIVKQPNKGGDWSPYDLAANSFGQGISATSFQMINAVAAIANRGVLLQPQVVRDMVEDGEVHPIGPRVLGRPIRPETALSLAQMMVYTVDSSSMPTPVPGYRVAGKTGTAEIPTKEGYTSLDSIMSFIGFLPAADPQVVIMVQLNKPQTAKWAEQVAMPVFADVGQDAVQILDIKPDNRKP